MTHVLLILAVLAQALSCGTMKNDMAEKKKDPAAVALAKKRAAALTPKRRQEIARKAARERWENRSSDNKK